jgi:hypothetical protein
VTIARLETGTRRPSMAPFNVSTDRARCFFGHSHHGRARPLCSPHLGTDQCVCLASSSPKDILALLVFWIAFMAAAIQYPVFRGSYQHANSIWQRRNQSADPDAFMVSDTLWREGNKAFCGADKRREVPGAALQGPDDVT